jgi:hypothetical protein
LAAGSNESLPGFGELVELSELLKRNPGESGISGPGFVVAKPATALLARDP